ncbi:MAG TPA: hypothetical protein VME46_17770 [Acidimicrobiales bacterium]|nr:hypothetical protein [Acidimicrobiales bacterium]
MRTEPVERTAGREPRDRIGRAGFFCCWVGHRRGPVTYVLEGLQSLVIQRWRSAASGAALLSIAARGTPSMSTCLAALRRRTRRD